MGSVVGLREDRELAVILCLLQDFQRIPDRKRELDPGSSSQTQGDEKMEIPEGVQAASEQNNSLPSAGKRDPVAKQMLLDVTNFSLLFLQQRLEVALVLISYISF